MDEEHSKHHLYVFTIFFGLVCFPMLMSAVTILRFQKACTDDKEARRIHRANVVDDMHLTSEQMRHFLVGESVKTNYWPNGIITYVISPTIKGEKMHIVDEALAEIENDVPCVKFRRRGNESSFLFITSQNTECSSTVGYSKTNNRINLGPKCFRKGIILHGLLHVLGMVHEHQSPNRDKFITIKWDHIQEKGRLAFKMFQQSEVARSLPYDYNSIMHYPAFVFSQNGQRTILVKDPNIKIGQRKELSDIDKRKLAIMYGCGKQ